MPNRWVTSGIVVFWLGMMGWLAGRELWQHYGQRPTFQDSLDAAVDDGPTYWSIKQSRFERIGTAETQVTRNPDTGTYRLLQKVNLDRYSFLDKSVNLSVDSRSEINRAGELQQIAVTLAVAGLGQVEFLGQPRGNELQVTLRGQLFGQPIPEKTESIPYDPKNLVLSSLSPLNRMPDLRPGLSWQVPMVDPLDLLTSQTLTSQTIERRPITVTVDDEPHPLFWNGERTACHVVRSQQSGLRVEIWVRIGDGLVLMQRASWGMEPHQKTLEVIREVRRPNSETTSQRDTLFDF